MVDLACGNGPLAPELAVYGWVGIDLSDAELSAAHDGAHRVIHADVASLPVADGSAGSVVCSMALMLVQPLERVLSEVARVLRPGGVLVALLPSRGPLRPRDVMRYTRLLAALGKRRLDYPNDGALGDVGALMGRHNLHLVDDRRRMFTCLITSPSIGVMCVRSLYLPDIEPARLAAGERVARSWVGRDLGLPLRRVVAVRGSS
ncbi:MAG: class I SAM-dependent methyltransferase [Actinomycetota bacterium]|nr:class I SAM-dependent methyltransferase [Actinomycetota bacterium]